jgi:hypothetical protein
MTHARVRGGEVCYNALVMYAEKHRAGWIGDIKSNYYFNHPKSSKITSTSVINMEDI